MYNLRYQSKGNLSAENNSNCQETNPPMKMQNGSFKMLLYLVHLCRWFWLCVNPGSIVSETFNNVSTQEV